MVDIMAGSCCTQEDTPFTGNISMTQVDEEIDVQDLLAKERIQEKSGN
jgi:hypothetical protein